MGSGDGTVLGRTKIVDHGSPAQRFNLVLVGEGYTSAQQSDFNTHADSFVNALFAMAPFDAMQAAFNVYRVNVESTDSGADDPVACGGSGAAPATYFDARFCNAGIRRLLVVDSALVTTVVAAQVPQYHHILVLVNSSIYGGSGGSVGVFSMAPSANDIGIHEMGHAAFGLADEYEYWAGCGVDTDRNVHPAVEPAEPNVTIDTNRNTIKWRDLINPDTAMPTTENADCSMCDPQGNPVAADTVGAFEGAHYYHCDAYRPQFDCMMRALGHPFCAVCQERIRATLAPYMPIIRRWPPRPDRWRFPFDELPRGWRPGDWVSDPSPMDRLRDIRGGRPIRTHGEPERDVLSRVVDELETLEPGQLRAALLDVRAHLQRLETAAAMIEERLGKTKR